MALSSHTSWRSLYSRGSRLLVDAVFPQRCPACRTWCADGFCPACRAALQPVQPPFCGRCGLPFDAVSTATLCSYCRTRRSLSPTDFGIIRSAYAFEGPMRPAIHRLKYEGKTALAAPLATLLHEFLMNQPAAGPARPQIPVAKLRWIVPVPLHPLRRWRRGYNQSELLARALAKLLSDGHEITCAELLQRIRYTGPQVELDRSHRSDNVRGVFAAASSFHAALRARPGAILLIDDVCTTGATLDECARVLKEAGVSEVYSLTLARQL